MTSTPPTQPPAAPETDVSAWEQLDKVLVYLWSTTGSRRGANGRQSQLDYGKRQARMAVERIVAERVRVVEGERDAARASLRLSMTSLTSACDFLLKASGLPADTDDIDLIEETVLGRIARAESAEAAHRALQAAVEALADEWDAADEHGNPLREGSFGEAADELRALAREGR